MIRTACLLIGLCVFAMVASAQDDPLAWFPLEVGSHWVYEYEAKSGDRNRPDVDRWTTEETITAWVTIPEGLVVAEAIHFFSSHFTSGGWKDVWFQPGDGVECLE